MAQIVWRGESYEVIDPLEWVRPEASFVRKATGLTVVEVARLAMQSDPDAICALLYVARKRAGEKVRWADFDDFTVAECDFVFDDDEQPDDDDGDGEDQAEGGADPTPPSPTGQTRTGGSSTTSTRSRSTSGSTRGKSTS